MKNLKKWFAVLLSFVASAILLVGCNKVSDGKDKSDDNGGWNITDDDISDDDTSGGDSENNDNSGGNGSTDEPKEVTVKSLIDDILNAESYTFTIDNTAYFKYEDGNIYARLDSVNSELNYCVKSYMFIYDGSYYAGEERSNEYSCANIDKTKYFYLINRNRFNIFSNSKYDFGLYLRCLSFNIKAFASEDGGNYVLKQSALKLVDNDISSLTLSVGAHGLKATAVYGKKTYVCEFIDVNDTVITIPKQILNKT